MIFVGTADKNAESQDERSRGHLEIVPRDHLSSPPQRSSHLRPTLRDLPPEIDDRKDLDQRGYLLTAFSPAATPGELDPDEKLRVHDRGNNAGNAQRGEDVTNVCIATLGIDERARVDYQPHRSRSGG